MKSTQAIQKIAKEVKNGNMKLDDITEERFSR